MNDKVIFICIFVITVAAVSIWMLQNEPVLCRRDGQLEHCRIVVVPK